MPILGDRWRTEKAVFSRPAALAIAGGGWMIFLLLRILQFTQRTVLLTPVDAQVRATLIAIGVFGGLWVAAAVRDLLGRRTRPSESAPRSLAWLRSRGSGLTAHLVLAVALGIWSGLMAADQATELRAFVGFRTFAVADGYVVADITPVYHSSDWLDLVGPSGDVGELVGAELPRSLCRRPPDSHGGDRTERRPTRHVPGCGQLACRSGLRCLPTAEECGDPLRPAPSVAVSRPPSGPVWSNPHGPVARAHRAP